MVACFGVGWLAAQTKQTKEKPARGPVLLRDDRTQDPETPATDQSPAAPDPKKAKTSFKVANFYLKRKNYDAAVARFREAVAYRADYSEAKWMVVDTLAAKGDWAGVIESGRAYSSQADMASYGDRIKSLVAKAEVEAAKPQSPPARKEPPKEQPILY